MILITHFKNFFLSRAATIVKSLNNTTISIIYCINYSFRRKSYLTTYISYTRLYTLNCTLNSITT
nr:MAG TPA: hypothetical protein [Caudoviricetes sp.]